MSVVASEAAGGRNPIPAVRALVVATIVAAIAVLSSPALGSADTHVRYVALGDSRAAGPYLDAAARLDGCARSNLGYPGVVAQILHPESFTNVSCTGARTEHLTSVPQQTSTGPVPPQLDALRPDTTLSQSVSVATTSPGPNWFPRATPVLRLSMRTVGPIRPWHREWTLRSVHSGRR